MNFRSSFLKSSSVIIETQRFYNNNLINLLKSMPREVSNIAKLQKQRNKIKEKATKYPPGTVDLQFLCPSSSGPASVYVFTDTCRYLFNCGEGTQRLAHEHRTKLARLDHVFMTRTSWSTIGGLPGLCLTLQDTGVPELVLHGPPGLDEVFRATKKFVVLRDLKVNTIEATTNVVEDFEDIVMTVKHIPLQKKMAQDDRQVENAEEEIVAVDQVDYYGYENKTKFKPKLDVSDAVQRLVQRTEYCVSAYVCKLKPKPGTLDLEKCVDKQVPPGPLLGQLKNGFDVKLEDGTIVLSRDVRGPDDPGPKFIFLDIPSEDYMESLIENQSRFLDDSDATASVVVHFGPNEIITSPAYVQFISKFPESTTHLVANGSKSFNGYVAAHRIQFQLNQLEPNVFPVLHEAFKFENMNELDASGTLKKKMRLDSPIPKSVDSISMDNNKFINVSTLTSFHLRPLKGLDMECEATISSNDYIKELEAIPGCLDMIAQVKSEIHAKIDQSRESKYPKIVFLGTGSCIPNKTRNVSGILVHINSETCILLDCGEGTAAQIYRFYGKTKGCEILKSLKAIYVSHLHADHHLGLIGLLQERQAVLKEDLDPLFLFAPQQISFWLAFYDKRIEGIKKTYNLVPNSSMLKDPFVDLESSGINRILTCFVKHCPHSFGITIETCSSDTPTKITYSGDTMPCSNLVMLGKDSTILIHEATMEDDLEEEAKYKMHSTVSQAINQGLLMNAKYTILTHFSQRYAKLPRLEFDTLKENVGLAFDNMEVTLDDLPKLHKLYPALKAMFMEHCEDMDNKAMKRSLKKQRQNLSRQASPEKL